MQITPEANNAIVITLDDKSYFRLHHTLHGDRDRLYIINPNGLIIETMDSNSEWKPITNISGKETMIRITAMEG